MLVSVVTAGRYKPTLSLRTPITSSSTFQKSTPRPVAPAAGMLSPSVVASESIKLFIILSFIYFSIGVNFRMK